MPTAARKVLIAIDAADPVSGLVLVPPSARACYVFAHGAGAGMDHPFMTAVADGLAQRQVACLRYQFPFMQGGSRRPDPPAVAHAAVRAAVNWAARELSFPLVAGGKSFGGRMSSQAEAEQPMREVRGIAFVGFPLHPAGKPSVARAKHLADVTKPMLFLQGTRDALAEQTLLLPLVSGLEPLATLHSIEHADHSFHVLARSGRSDAEVLEELVGALSGWIISLA